MDANDQTPNAAALQQHLQQQLATMAADPHAAQQYALFQAQQQQLLQQMQQQPQNEQLRAMLSNNLLMMPHLMMNPAMFSHMAATQPSPSPPSAVSEASEEEPVYVNAKQYHRIMVRRQQRAKLEAKLGNVRQRKAYLHDSRHQHAMRRPRGPGGRFLTRSEIEGLKDGSMRFEDLPLKAAK